MSSTLHGIPATAGIAIGPWLLYDPTPPSISHERIQAEAVPAECVRLKQAIQAAAQDVMQLRDRMEAQIGKEEAAIFDAHLMIIEDDTLSDGAVQRIEGELMNAEWALWEAAEEFAQMLAGMEDSYFQARASDMYDIRARIIRHLQGRPAAQLQEMDEPRIIVARDLLPSDTAGLDPRFVLGLITEQGGPTSHTAILARQLGIPAVLGVRGLLSSMNTTASGAHMIILDGNSGTVIVDPDAATTEQYQAALQAYRQQQQELLSMRALSATTPDGLTIEVAANIGRAKDAPPAVEAGAGGVGLFRTEFLFLDRKTPPGEDEQYAAYRAVLEAFSGKNVIVRTLDIGGDKSIPYLQMEPESNPFLGLRGIRLCLAESYQYLFRIQLRALLRAAEKSPAALWIMFPMVDDLRELHEARVFLKETEDALLAEGVLKAPVLSEVRVGIMIETPSAALLVDVLSHEADFFSIGTNDLAQYTLASDRMNANLAALHRPFHPAVMRSIAHIITTARQQQRWVGMCGEMAGDPRAAVFLLGLGINELSMESSSLNAVKRVIRNTTLPQAQEVVQHVLQAESAEAIEALLSQ